MNGRTFSPSRAWAYSMVQSGEFRAGSRLPEVCLCPCPSVLGTFRFTSWGLSFLIRDECGDLTRAGSWVPREASSIL